jgi:hypothetical protein
MSDSIVRTVTSGTPLAQPVTKSFREPVGRDNIEQVEISTAE